jgi:hypothetical protein
MSTALKSSTFMGTSSLVTFFWMHFWGLELVTLGCNGCWRWRNQRLSRSLEAQEATLAPEYLSHFLVSSMISSEWFFFWRLVSLFLELDSRMECKFGV